MKITANKPKKKYIIFGTNFDPLLYLQKSRILMKILLGTDPWESHS